MDNDLLKGVPFNSNLKLQAGDFFKLTDGLGNLSNSSFRTFAKDGVEDWVITFSNLKIIELKEVRVFSWNGDSTQMTPVLDMGPDVQILLHSKDCAFYVTAR